MEDLEVRIKIRDGLLALFKHGSTPRKGIDSATDIFDMALDKVYIRRLKNGNLSLTFYPCRMAFLAKFLNKGVREGGKAGKA
jgi:hypothetical protein